MTLKDDWANGNTFTPAAANAVATQVNANTAALAAIDADVTAAVEAAIDAFIAGAPEALATLNKSAAALNDDENFAATVTAALAARQPIDADLTAIAALTTTSYGRSLLTQADAAATRTTIQAPLYLKNSRSFAAS